jgi:hypothetical protein
MVAKLIAVLRLSQKLLKLKIYQSYRSSQIPDLYGTLGWGVFDNIEKMSHLLFKIIPNARPGSSRRFPEEPCNLRIISAD